MSSTTSRRSPMLPWLQLVRLPTVFTALADILLGSLLATNQTLQAPSKLAVLLHLLVASAGLYLAGMVFNDVFDRHRDAQTRPGRPIPSGRITPRAATTLGVILLAGGILSAGVTSLASLAVAGVLAVCVLAYDGGLKTTVLGPVAMGCCRSLNILLGASLSGSFESLLEPAPVHVAIGMGIYITGVTWFARTEDATSHRGQLTAAVIVINAGLATLLTYAGLATSDGQQQSNMSVLLLMALIIVSINRRLVGAVMDPRPERVQPAVGVLLLSLIMLDATLALAKTGQTGPALLIASLLVPAVLLRRWLPMT